MKAGLAVGFLQQMMYALSPTAQDIVAGSSVAANFTDKIQYTFPLTGSLV